MALPPLVLRFILSVTDLTYNRCVSCVCMCVFTNERKRETSLSVFPHHPFKDRVRTLHNFLSDLKENSGRHMHMLLRPRKIACLLTRSVTVLALCEKESK